MAEDKSRDRRSQFHVVRGGNAELAKGDRVPADEPAIKFNFKVINPRGRVIFEKNGLDNFGPMKDPQNAGYKSFIFLDTWKSAKGYDTVSIRPGLQNTVYVDSYIAPSRGFVLEYPEDASQIFDPVFSLIVLNVEGKELLKKENIYKWGFVEDPDNLGWSPFIALDMNVGDGERRDIFQPSAGSLVMFSGVVTIK